MDTEHLVVPERKKILNNGTKQKKIHEEKIHNDVKWIQEPMKDLPMAKIEITN